MKRLASLPLALLVFAAACGEGTVTTPVAVTPRTLTPRGPSFDEIANSVDASIDAAAEVMPLTVPGAPGTTTLYVQPTGDDGKNGCNLTGSTTLKVSVSSSNAAVATVSISSDTFTSCGDVKTLTVTPVSVGSATISVSQVSNSTGGTFNFAPATFTVNVTAATPTNTAPTIAVMGVTGGASYSKGSVPAATCQVTDAEDGNSTFPATLSAITGPYASDGIGSQTASCSYTDGGGLMASASETYSIVDPSAPTIGYTLNPTSPDGSNGWYKSNVALTWTVTENESPSSLLKIGCVDANVTADQQATTYSCSATSAGGSAAEVSVSIKRDATAPSITPGDINNTTWRNTDLSETFTASDATSGLANAADASFTLTASNESANAATPTTVSKTVTDNAGNSTTRTLSALIDKTRPTVSAVSLQASFIAAGTGSTTLSAAVGDALSGVSKAEYSKDGGTTWLPMDITGSTASASISGLSVGVYNLCVRTTDVAGNESAPDVVNGCAFLAVYDPSAGFVTGGGWINSPAGAYTADASMTGKANFGFVSKYQRGATTPTGNTEFQFKAGNLNFKSTSYEWLVIAGARAQYKGEGTINGSGAYGFMLTAIDGQENGGGGADKFRIKIWYKATGAVVYDNQPGAGDDATPTTLLGGGSIQIQTR